MPTHAQIAVGGGDAGSLVDPAVMRQTWSALAPERDFPMLPPILRGAQHTLRRTFLPPKTFRQPDDLRVVYTSARIVEAILARDTAASWPRTFASTLCKQSAKQTSNSSVT